MLNTSATARGAQRHVLGNERGDRGLRLLAFYLARRRELRIERHQPVASSSDGLRSNYLEELETIVDRHAISWLGILGARVEVWPRSRHLLGGEADPGRPPDRQPRRASIRWLYEAFSGRAGERRRQWDTATGTSRTDRQGFD